VRQTDRRRHRERYRRAEKRRGIDIEKQRKKGWGPGRDGGKVGGRLEGRLKGDELTYDNKHRATAAEKVQSALLQLGGRLLLEEADAVVRQFKAAG